MVVTNATVDSNVVNTSPGNGGGIHLSGDGSINVTRGSVSGNTAGSEGGGLWNSLGTMTIRGTLIEGNGLDQAAIASAVQDVLKLKGDVQCCAPGTLPRDGLVIEDRRTYET